MASNICNYSPMITLSLREINQKFSVVHRNLCYALAAAGADLSQVYTQNSPSVTWTGTGTQGDPLIATATASAIPAGADTQVQYNNAGAFGAEAAFTYNQSTNTLGVDTVSVTTAIGIGISPLTPFHIEGATVANPSATIVNTDALGATSGANLSLYVKALPNATSQRLGLINFGSRNGASANSIGASIQAISNGAWVNGTNHQTALIFSTANSAQGSPAERMRIQHNGNIGIGQTVATARLHLPAGLAGASSAPIKLAAGVNLTTPEDGAIEYDGTSLYFTTGGTRRNLLSAAANPTAQVGTAAINGVATTFMRSDAAPAINQAITPTWTGVHTFNNNVSVVQPSSGQFSIIHNQSALSGPQAAFVLQGNNNAGPAIGIGNTSQGTDGKWWDIMPVGNALNIRTVSDGGSPVTTILGFTRSGSAVTGINSNSGSGVWDHTGGMKISTLAGTGIRTVVTDATGNLSAEPIAINSVLTGYTKLVAAPLTATDTILQALGRLEGITDEAITLDYIPPVWNTGPNAPIAQGDTIYQMLQKLQGQIDALQP